MNDERSPVERLFNEMTTEERKHIRDVLDNEGFVCAFKWYSDFKKIKDPYFHKLREAFLKAYDKLNEYIGPNEDGEWD